MEDSVTMEETSDDEDSSRLSFSSMGFANLPERQDIIVEKTEKNTHKEKALRTLRTDKRAIESGPGGHFLVDNGEPMAYCRCRSSDCSQVIVACDHCEEKCVGVGEPAVKFIIKSACVPSEEKTPTLSVINKERRKKKEKSKLDKPSEKKITKKKKQFLKEKKMKMKDRLKMKRSKKLKMMQTKEKRGIGSGEKTGASEAEPSGDYSPATNAQNVTKAAQQANRRCGECEACKRKDDCGQCVFCMDMKKVGGPIKIRQKCRFKQCLKRASPNIFQLGSMFFTFPDQTPRRDATIAWCREHGLLSTEMTCPSCDDRCKEVRRERCKDKVAWRCRNTKCRKIINLRKGSFFESSHLELWQIIGLSHIWASSGRRTQGPTQLSIMRDICVSSSVVADWKQFLRDVCVQYFADEHEQIGGPGKVVEVYESFFTHRKNSVGRQRQQRWVLCGFEQARKIGFMVEVPSRDAATLLPIIEHWVAPGSVIWTDLRGAYAHLGNQPGLGDIHETVNHKVHFMDPAKGVTTMWARAKAKYKASHRSTKPNSIGDYLKEFMWFQRFGDSAFYQLWLQIADLYPV